MKSIRRFAYATVLTLSALSLMPNRASAQDAHGRFSLSHEVRWQSATIPAGDYRFSLDSTGASTILTLNKMSGGRGGFMLLVNDSEVAKPAGINRLVLVSRKSGSFVSEMALPDYGMILHFNVPAESIENEVALATPTTAVVPAQ